MIGERPLRTMLLICLKERRMYPFSSLGLICADGRQSDLRLTIEENYIFDHDGKIRKIEDIVFKRPRGDTLTSQFLSRIFGNWFVQLKLSEPLRISLSEIKSIISRCVPDSTGMDEIWLPDKDATTSFLRMVYDSGSAVELFENLRLPSPENALDSL